MQKLLCPSIMCADYGSLRDEIRNLEEAGANMLHVDIIEAGNCCSGVVHWLPICYHRLGRRCNAV